MYSILYSFAPFPPTNSKKEKKIRCFSSYFIWGTRKQKLILPLTCSVSWEVCKVSKCFPLSTWNKKSITIIWQYPGWNRSTNKYVTVLHLFTLTAFLCQNTHNHEAKSFGSLSSLFWLGIAISDYSIFTFVTCHWTNIDREWRENVIFWS